MTSAYVSGLLLGLSLIIAIGAQNVFVLRQGIRREHVWLVVVLCALSDIVLITLGIQGLGAAIAQLPWLLTAVRWAGFAFLLAYGLIAAKRAWRPSATGLDADDSESLPAAAASLPASAVADGSAFAPDGTDALAPRTGNTAIVSRPGIRARNSAPQRARSSLLTVGLTTLAITWLNPHVYLDTVFLLGSIGSTHGDARWLFAFGAYTAGIIWFTLLGFGARLLSTPLSSPRAWRIVDVIIAVTMITLAFTLVLS